MSRLKISRKWQVEMLRWGCFIIISFLFLLVFAGNSSPVSLLVGSDYDIFRTMGNAWVSGLVPFRDIFDNKGPYQFLIQAFGLWIKPGMWGIFILCAINLAVCLELLWRIGRTLTACRWAAVLGIIVYLAGFTFTIEGGDTVEEWSMPFVLLSLLLYVKFVCRRDKEQPMPLLHAALIGACLGFIAFLRVNNAAIVCGIVTALAIEYLCRKWYKRLSFSVLVFLAGMICAMLPAIIYLAVNGAVSDMIHAAFIYNIDYKSAWFSYQVDRGVNAMRLSVCLLSCIAAWLYQKKTGYKVFAAVLCGGLFSALSFYDIVPYRHYFTMLLPFAFLIATLGWRTMPSLLYGIVLMATLLPDIGTRIYTVRHHVAMFANNVCRLPEAAESRVQRDAGIVSAIDVIPEAERDSIYQMTLVDDYAGVVYLSGHNPIGKYFGQQDYVARVNEYTKSDILSNFDKTNPLWIVASYDITEGVMAERVQRYCLVDSAGPLFLYRRID